MGQFENEKQRRPFKKKSEGAKINAKKFGKPGPSVQHKQKKKKQSRKNQIRNLSRLLRKEGLPEEQKHELQQKIKMLESEISDHKTKERVDKMQDKYKKIKFFERKKVTRKISQTKKKIEKNGDPNKNKELQLRLKKLEDDLQYIDFYPPTQKYIGLFANENDDEKTMKRKGKMREMALKAARAAAEEKGSGGEGGDQDQSAEEDQGAIQAPSNRKKTTEDSKASKSSTSKQKLGKKREKRHNLLSSSGEKNDNNCDNSGDSSGGDDDDDFFFLDDDNNIIHKLASFLIDNEADD
eukprot:CAMPEP_0206363460 /NCGR_PEP_ID=MMETSP0294-20121207/1607_1 /ASSEMBLY_ACC=CAM_ASM_000327 /TAXON_ID=39354 /ORGANISM="Heterosigma akashiwo, Strain CCMP2393" /LENGTH=294 /DNA_ID=CAMNT_0053808813 /DNA_START=47 /DNA_END=929 /DNA_ORIENTATION=+